MKQGDKVICVNGKFESRETDPFTKEQLNLPKNGRVYTVRQKVETDYGFGIRLVEVINSRFYHDQGGLQEPSFDVNRFELCS